MNKKLKLAAITGALALATAGTVTIAQLNGEQAAAIAGDFRNAGVAEVHGLQGQVLMRGSFAPADSDDEGEVERLAPLTAVAPEFNNAKGEAEVEYQTDAPTDQEVELSLTGAPAGTEITFVIDGQRIATAKADNRGRISLELKVKAGA
ncbi:MAG: hypothetical protein ACRD1W_21225 [Vicinamibacterales bacterium]